MSIFPKRAVPGNTITIHWCFLPPASAAGEPICPFVRIGVRDPAGSVRMLCERSVMAFPDAPVAGGPAGAQGPAVPLLVLAACLEGRRSRASLVEMLGRLRDGIHFYFHYPLDAGVPLGRYSLLSEIHWEGRIIGSGTAEEDFFLVERLEPAGRDKHGTIKIRNPSPEPVPARQVEAYWREDRWTTSQRNLLFPPGETLTLATAADRNVLVYAEGRENLDLDPPGSPRVRRNPDVLWFPKPGLAGGPLHLLHASEEKGMVLEEPYRGLWARANGLETRDALRAGAGREAYAELLQAGFLEELPRSEDGRL